MYKNTIKIIVNLEKKSLLVYFAIGLKYTTVAHIRIQPDETTKIKYIFLWNAETHCLRKEKTNVEIS